jgi:hypothetical protein
MELHSDIIKCIVNVSDISVLFILTRLNKKWHCNTQKEIYKKQHINWKTYGIDLYRLKQGITIRESGYYNIDFEHTFTEPNKTKKYLLIVEADNVFIDFHHLYIYYYNEWFINATKANNLIISSCNAYNMNYPYFKQTEQEYHIDGKCTSIDSSFYFGYRSLSWDIETFSPLSIAIGRYSIFDADPDGDAIGIHPAQLKQEIGRGIRIESKSNSPQELTNIEDTIRERKYKHYYPLLSFKTSRGYIKRSNNRRYK